MNHGSGRTGAAWRVWLWGAMCAALLSGCAGNRPLPEPRMAALERGQKAVSTGVRQALARAEAVKEIAAPARRNPCQCDAPPDEVYVYGRWVRAYLTGEALALAQFAARMQAAGARGVPGTMLLVGVLSGATRRDERQVEYPVFEVRALGEP